MIKALKITDTIDAIVIVRMGITANTRPSTKVVDSETIANFNTLSFTATAAAKPLTHTTATNIIGANPKRLFSNLSQKVERVCVPASTPWAEMFIASE
ncbi:MAG: hypothetical protein IT235_09120 [Bacteroidia bacterium]|nr:hypothetical protein [Bacteroidia bacterium]